MLKTREILRLRHELGLSLRENGLYTQRFNQRHQRVGHLFQGRYKAILVDKDNYLLELCRYVVLNPVRTKIVKEPKDKKPKDQAMYEAHLQYGYTLKDIAEYIGVLYYSEQSD